MVTGSRVPRSRFWRRPNLVPVLEGKRSKIVSMVMAGLLSRARRKNLQTKSAKQTCKPNLQSKRAALRRPFASFVPLARLEIHLQAVQAADVAVDRVDHLALV